MSKSEFLEFDFGQVSIFNDHIIVVMDEDSTVQNELVPILQDIADTYFKNKPFVYIANRINNYAVDPLIYKAVSKINNLVGFAVVSKSPNAQNQISIESRFYDKEFKQFKELQQAVAWASDYTRSIKSNSKYPTLSDFEPTLIEIDICSIQVYKSYSIVNIKEGATVKPGDEAIFKRLIAEYYGDKPFVYISHRVHSYAIDPIIYKEISKIETLLGYAVVDEKSKMYSSAQVEKLFYDKAFEIFNDLDEAKEWAKKMLNDDFTPNLC
ncbi:hypothetical protein [Spongiivirga citrea]|uniref:STAS/SEC14 domain-containing protein n=1 Tax=Spongiivirga citrea TaxID=1481457 RepID=A0A6M0CIG4_9FLAO|nr:hypothetical protein [Spongiivirga citrea]NER15754.1 hypothetical protein [Spongiivirga citrea]